MSIAIVEYKISGADAATTSKSVTFTSPGQPTAGNKIVVIGGNIQSDAGAFTLSAPADLNVIYDEWDESDIGFVVKDKTASGSGEATATASKAGAARALALVALNLSGVGALQTKGKYNSSNASVDGATVVTDANVAVDGSLAVAVFFRHGTLQGGSMSYTFSGGLTELAKAADWASPAGELEIYVVTGIVNSGAPAACTFDPAGVNSKNAAIILVYPPALSVPGAPTGLVATPNGGSQIDLAWTAPVNDGGAPIDGYRIERETGIGNGWELIVSHTGSTATSYPDAGLVAGQLYNYRVSGINSQGVGTASSADSATTDAATVPDPPTSLTVVGESPTTVILNWTAPVDVGGSEILGYTIERESPVGNGFSVVVPDTEGAGTTYRDVMLDSGVEYNYKVSARNAIGSGAASAAAAAITPGPASNAKLGRIAFALDESVIPLAEGAVLDRADRQHLLGMDRSPLIANKGLSLIAQQVAWYDAAVGV